MTQTSFAWCRNYPKLWVYLRLSRCVWLSVSLPRVPPPTQISHTYSDYRASPSNMAVSRLATDANFSHKVLISFLISLQLLQFYGLWTECYIHNTEEVLDIWLNQSHLLFKMLHAFSWFYIFMHTHYAYLYLDTKIETVDYRSVSLDFFYAPHPRANPCFQSPDKNIFIKQMKNILKKNSWTNHTTFLQRRLNYQYLICPDWERRQLIKILYKILALNTS